MSTVSVQIVTYNSADDIQKCLESVFQQTEPEVQVIVVDNASTDDTLDRLREWEDRVLVVPNEANVGFAAAHNQALRLSESDFVLVLNPDMTLHEDYLRCLVSFAHKHPQAGSLTGKLLFQHANDLIDSTGLHMRSNRRAFDRSSGTFASECKDEAEVFGVSGAAAFYRREMIRDISFEGQFFDESFFAYKEDVDVAWRARLFGWEAFYVTEAVGFHKRGWKQKGRSRQPLKIRQHSYINRYRMIIKNDRLGYLLAAGPRLFVYEIASFCYFLLREPCVLFAWVAFFRNWSNLIKQRQWIQKRRKAESNRLYDFFVEK